MASRYSVFFLACVIAVIGSMASAAVVEHTFNVGTMTVRMLCKNMNITVVNGQFPGPTIQVHEGDKLIIHVLNKSPYNITIHWHGIFQYMTAWADGPNFITQCPIRPGSSYTYRFSVVGQEGTLWWHAHASMLRATVYGALIILPRQGTEGYPFSKPYKEVPIILGEWWNANVVEVERESLLSGLPPNNSDAFTINARPGDLYGCSKKHTYKLNVVHGKTYMLRIINAAVDNQLFFKVAGHQLKVVAADATYKVPYTTDVLIIAPGQTLDVLMVADAPSARYYMAAHPYISSTGTFANTTTTGIICYKGIAAAWSPPAMPVLPAFNDTPTAHRFYTSLTELMRPGSPTVPLHVDEHMFIAFGLALAPCEPDQTTCQGFAQVGNMNNISFQFPTKMSLLEAHYKGVKGIYTLDFPDSPPVVFDYTNDSLSEDAALMFTTRGTKLKKLKFNSTVEIVLQNTATLSSESHPMHLHGVDFFVLAQGFGNYNATTAQKSYNLVNPQRRNTIAVPDAGWAVIRFTANNPVNCTGIWMLHCHLDRHLPAGLGTAFEVENGPTPSTTLPPPPADYPQC